MPRIRGAGEPARSRETPPQYMKWNLYGPGVFPGDERGSPDAAISARLRDCRPKHLLTHAFRLRELAAINIDLDVGTRKDGSRYVDAGDALGIVAHMVGSGGLPAPSAVGFSGQGLYLLYALIGEGGRTRSVDRLGEAKLLRQSRLPEATKENQQAFKDAAGGLMQRCLRVRRSLVPPGLPPTLCPDPTSKNTVQWFKTPDSPHAKTGKAIQYYLFNQPSTLCVLG